MNTQNPVRWYLRYSLSYRDLEEMMKERGLDTKPYDPLHPRAVVVTEK